MKQDLLVSKTIFILSYGIGAIIATLLMFFIINALWSNPEIIYAHIFNVKQLLFAVPFVFFILVLFWAAIYYERLKRRSCDLKSFLIIGFYIAFLSFISFIALLAIQGAVFDNSPTGIIELISKLFISFFILGGILFGWLVLLGALIPSYLLWKRNDKLN